MRLRRSDTILRSSDFILLAATAAAVGLGVGLNPFLTTWLDREQAALGIVVVAALTAIMLEVVRALRLLNGAPCAKEGLPLTPDPSPTRGEGSCLFGRQNELDEVGIHRWSVFFAFAAEHRQRSHALRKPQPKRPPTR